MEPELGLKITKTLDDLSSSTSNIRIAKDRAGSVFFSQETDSMFILTAHLNGYKRDNIGIKINEDGSQISISGKKAIEEMEMKGSIMYKKEMEIREFEKIFLIPKGVILDKIKAKFNEDEAVLTIFMPKLVKVIQGINIQESENKEKPEKNVILGDQIAAEESCKNTEMGQIVKENSNKPIEEIDGKAGKSVTEESESEKEKESHETEEYQIEKSVSKRGKMCNPLLIAGSVLVASIVVLVIQIIKAKKR